MSSTQESVSTMSATPVENVDVVMSESVPTEEVTTPVEDVQVVPEVKTPKKRGRKPKTTKASKSDTSDASSTTSGEVSEESKKSSGRSFHTLSVVIDGVDVDKTMLAKRLISASPASAARKAAFASSKSKKFECVVKVKEITRGSHGKTYTYRILIAPDDANLQLAGKSVSFSRKVVSIKSLKGTTD